MNLAKRVCCQGQGPTEDCEGLICVLAARRRSALPRSKLGCAAARSLEAGIACGIAQPGRLDLVSEGMQRAGALGRSALATRLQLQEEARRRLGVMCP
jgi:hypothetical protein